MLLLLAAAAVGVTSPEPRSEGLGAVVQARATVRIVSGVRLSLDGRESPGVPKPRDTRVTSRDGSKTPAKLVEFE